MTGDRELALTALVVRALERERTRVSPSDVLGVERRIVQLRFGGSTQAYRSALAEAGASLPVARGLIGDELRFHEIERRLATPSVSAADISRFRATFASVLARELVVSPAPSWLPTGRGIALATSAPGAVFRLETGRRTTIRTVEGTFTVEAVDDVTALAAVSSDLARPAIIGEIRSARRTQAYADWSIRRQKAAESKLVCERDRLPELGVVDMSGFVPFLSLHDPEAERWAARSRMTRPTASPHRDGPCRRVSRG